MEAAPQIKFHSWNADIYIITWNVSTKFPDSISIDNLFGLDSNPENDKHCPDFYIIGLQEMNSQPQNVVKGLFKDDPWTAKIKELLKIREYVAIKSEQMQGLFLIIFAKRRHLLHIRNVESELTRTGLGGIWGNKGAVSIRFSLYGCSVCIVNAHLAAHDHMLEERLKDYDKIIEDHKYHVRSTVDIFSHDYVFWFGDLNFRLTGEATTSPEDIREMIENDKLSDLLERDQLVMIRRQGRAFHNLEERLPAFPPTFKFEHGTCDYDMKRRPAWTDRILYKKPQNAYKNVQLSAEQTSYRSHPGFTLSDHKPVTSEFTIKFKELPLRPLRPIGRLNIGDNTDGLNVDANSYDNDNKQVFDDPTEVIIEFSPIINWYIGEDNIIQYSFPFGFEEAENDWIGIFREDFTSLDEYLAYEYTSRSKAPNDGDIPMDKITYRLEFPESIDIPEDGRYCLLYFQSTGTRGVSGLAGVSNVFKAERRCPSPRFESVD